MSMSKPATKADRAIELSVRRATPADYPAIARLHNATYGIGWPMTERALLTLDRGAHILGYEATPPRLAQRWVVYAAGELAAMALVRWSQLPTPHRYEINFILAPDWADSPDGDRLRDQLYDKMTAWIALRPHRQRAHELRSHTRADFSADLDFWQAQGFDEFLREQDALLTIADFDPTPHAQRLERLAAQGIRIVPFNSLPPGTATEQALFELEQALRRDVPGWAGEDFYSFAEWRTARVEAAEFLPAACFIALQGDAWIGMSFLTRQPDADFLAQRLTGVRRPLRRRGIAAALKLCGIDYARTQGYRAVRTSSAVDNGAMQHLNAQFGFLPDSTWVHFKKSLEKEA
jgi:GNAT superfamily N-acetyltransferase